MITISNLSFAYRRRKPVISDLSLELPDGSVYGLLGPNGAGKSTLLMLMAGALTPQSGSVMFNGTDTRRRLPLTLSDIFLVSEEFSLPSIPLRKYVELNAPFYPRFSADDLLHNLELFDMSADISLGALSMGQKKKAFISFALACNTSLLLMDEPTNGLDIPGKSAFRRSVAAGMTDERTIVISTHQVRDIDHILDHILIMNSERMVLDASSGEIQDRLSFSITSDPTEAAGALMTLPGIGGTNVMKRNTTGEPTEIDLELLFNFAQSNPALLAEIFNGNKQPLN